MQVTRSQVVYALFAVAALATLVLVIQNIQRMEDLMEDETENFNIIEDAGDKFAEYGLVDRTLQADPPLAEIDDMNAIENYADLGDSIESAADLTGAFPGEANSDDVAKILTNQNFLEAADIIGSAREPLRNSVIDIRGAPVIPKQVLSPWNNSTLALTHRMGLNQSENLF